MNHWLYSILLAFIPPIIRYNTMRYNQIVNLLLCLAVGQATAVVLDQTPYDLQCGIMDGKDAKLADCKNLLESDDFWTAAVLPQSDDTDKQGGPNLIAKSKSCYLFHRYAHSARDGWNTDIFWEEAKHLLGCAGRKRVNARASCGISDDNKAINTRHTLCVAGGKKQGRACFAGMTEAEKGE